VSKATETIPSSYRPIQGATFGNCLKRAGKHGDHRPLIQRVIGIGCSADHFSIGPIVPLPKQSSDCWICWQYFVFRGCLSNVAPVNGLPVDLEYLDLVDKPSFVGQFFEVQFHFYQEKALVALRDVTVFFKGCQRK